MTLVAGLDTYFNKVNSSSRIREVLLFTIKLAAIYLAWRLFIIFIGAQGQPINERAWPWLSYRWEVLESSLKSLLASTSLWVLKTMGYKAYMVGVDLIRVDGYGGVGIGNYCLAIELMVLFTALIVSYPSPLKSKLWFIPLGLFLIQFVNVLRIIALSLFTVHAPEYAEFNHHFTFRILVFIFILVLYNWYIKRYGNTSQTKNV